MTAPGHVPAAPLVDPVTALVFAAVYAVMRFRAAARAWRTGRTAVPLPTTCGATSGERACAAPEDAGG